MASESERHTARNHPKAAKKHFFIALPIAITIMSGCSETTVSAVDYVRSHATDVDQVTSAVANVQDATSGGLEDARLDPSAAATLSRTLYQAQQTFEAVNHTFLSAPKPKDLDTAGLEMWSATDKMIDAMKAGRAYLDDGKPSELVGYRDKWATGLAWWNQAVVPIWTAAGASTQPTISGVPPAPPVT